MPTSREIRSFLEEPAILADAIDSIRNNRNPLHDLDARIAARFGTLTDGGRRMFGKVFREVIEAHGGRHVQTGARPLKPQINAVSTYSL